MEVTAEEARTIIWEDHEDYNVVEDVIYQTSRWSEFHQVVVLQLSTGKFFMSQYTRGLTEQQDEQPWEYNKPEFTEVFAKEVTVIKYVVKEDL